VRLFHHRWKLIGFALVIIVYAILLNTLPKNVFWSPDEGVRFIMARALTDHVDQSVELPYPGLAKDPLYNFYPGVNNYLRVVYPMPDPKTGIRFPWPVFFPWLAGWLFQRLGITGIYILPFICGWLISLAAWRLTDPFAPDLSAWVAPVTGLATPIFFYSLTFWDHTLVSLLSLTAILILANGQLGELRRLLAAAFLLGAAVIMRLELAALALAVGLSWGLTLLPEFIATYKNTIPMLNEINQKSSRQKFLVGLAACTGIGIFIVTIFQAPVFLVARQQTQILRFFHLQADSNIPQFHLFSALSGMFLNLPHLLINFTGSDGPAMPLLWGWVGLTSLGLCFFAAWVKCWQVEVALIIPGLLTLVGLGFFVVLTTDSFRSLHGFFMGAPYMVISFYVLPLAWRTHQARLLFIALTATLYLIIGTMVILWTRGGDPGGQYWPGLEWGPRYLLTLYPLMTVLMILAVRAYWHSDRPRVVRFAVISLVVVLVLISCQIQMRGVWMLNANKQGLAAQNDYLLSQSQYPVVTDIWWLPASLADYFTSHEMYTLPRVESTWSWVAQAAIPNQVKRFTFVSLAPFDASQWSLDHTGLVQEKRFLLDGLYFTQVKIVEK